MLPSISCIEDLLYTFLKKKEEAIGKLFGS